MSALAAIFYREGRIRVTNLTFVFWDLFYPLGYLLVFGVGVSAALGAPSTVAGASYNAFFLAGVLGMASFGIASNTAWSFFLDRDNGIFFEMLTYPLSRAQYLLGRMLFTVFVSLLQAGITVGLGCWLLRIPVEVARLPLLVLGVAGGTAAQETAQHILGQGHPAGRAAAEIDTEVTAVIAEHAVVTPSSCRSGRPCVALRCADRP